MSLNVILVDECRENFLPFTYTRPVAAIRVGILTIAEKWQMLFNINVSYKTEEYLSKKYTISISNNNLWVNGNICPNKDLVEAVLKLSAGEVLVKQGNIIAINSGTEKSYNIAQYKQILFEGQFTEINHMWDIFSKNATELEADFKLLTANKKSQSISKTNQVISPENIFIEEGAKVECSILNASTGPIYIGKDAEIMEGCMVRGPFSLGEHATLKMGAKIYGATTIGPHSKVGGEINNSVIFGYSNKAHDGFLGNSVVGEWCNIGADSNNSNLKNNYAEVKLWHCIKKTFENTGLTFCGLMMADHSKCAINTMFNTGTVVGVNANIFGAGFPRNFVPNFSWGGATGFTTYKLKDAFEVAEKVFERRHLKFDDIEKDILTEVFNQTQNA